MKNLYFDKVVSLLKRIHPKLDAMYKLEYKNIVPMTMPWLRFKK